jgi:molybdopterin synthase sulfur carrier subunit
VRTRRHCLSAKIPDVTTLRYWAAAKEAAGVAAEELSGASLADVLERARARHDDRFAVVLRRCSFVVDGDPAGTRDHADVVVREDSLVDVLPPFAGG